MVIGYHSVLNVKELVGAFNQEKAIEGTFSVIVKTDCETDGSFYSTLESGTMSSSSSQLRLRHRRQDKKTAQVDTMCSS